MTKDVDAWVRIESLGGHGVWEPDLVVVSLKGTAITDDDLSLFREFPQVQILDLSETQIGETGLSHLIGITALTQLILIDSSVPETAIERFRQSRPDVEVSTKAASKGRVNPFTGEPL